MSIGEKLRQLFQRGEQLSTLNRQVDEEENTVWVRTEGLNVKLRTFPAVSHAIDSFDEPLTLFLEDNGPTRRYPRLKLEIVSMGLPADDAGMFALDLRKLLVTSAITNELTSNVVTRAVYNAAGKIIRETAVTKRRSRYELRPRTKLSNRLEATAAISESLRRESRILFEYRTSPEALPGQNTLTHWGQVVKLYEGESAGFLLKNGGGYRRYRYENITALALEEPGGGVPIVSKIEYDSLDPTKPLIRISNYHKQVQA